jgi:hypothetical protein
VTRGILIALAVIAALGAIFALLPSPPLPARGDVLLKDVTLALYPAADPDAKWSFTASEVRYNPDSRESTVIAPQDGRRVVNGKTDLTLAADEVTIDAADNIRVQQADIFIPEGCYLLRLGRPSGQPVFIDQSSGYKAPYVDIRSTNYRETGTNFDASFDLSTMGIDVEKLTVVDGGKETCEQVKQSLK